MKNVDKNYGHNQMSWLNTTLNRASNDASIVGVVLVHSWPWVSLKDIYRTKIDGVDEDGKDEVVADEENSDKVQAERRSLVQIIEGLEFNKFKGGRFLVMVSGDRSFITHDVGSKATNPEGAFPTYQCGPLDFRRDCSDTEKYSGPYSFENGQYCHFTYRQEQHDNGVNHCLKFEGYHKDEVL